MIPTLIRTETKTTLFAIAARYLDDATEWTRIAELNTLSDILVQSQIQLAIPAAASPQGS